MTVTYLISFNVYVACWLVMYLAGFSRSTFFKFNRVILLAGIGMAVLLSWVPVHGIASVVLSGGSGTAAGGYAVLSPGASAISAEAASVGRLVFWKALVVIYWAGVGIASALLAYKIVGLSRMLRKYPHKKHADYCHVIIPEGRGIFSFGRYLFAPDDIPQPVQKHELVHITQGHTADILALELLKIFCWFNPFIYLYLRTLKYLHEYQADAVSVRAMNKLDYAQLLVSHVFRIPDSAIAHHFFNRSFIQKRLMMLQKKESSPRRIYAQVILVTAMAALLFVSNSSFALRSHVDRLVSDLRGPAEGKPVAVEGSVTDEAGRPLARVTIMEMGTTTGVMTDKDGHFVLKEVTENSLLRFTMVGYNSVTVMIPASGDLKVKMYKQFNRIEQLVVVGYTDKAASEPVKRKPAKAAFTFVEQMPQFTGGKEALMKYLQSNVRYPQQARQRHLQGSVLVRFLIDSNGNIGQVQTTGPALGGGLDEEAVRIVKSMPRWHPGRQNGGPVDVWYTLPIKFVLQ